MSLNSGFYKSPDGVSIHGGFPNPATDASLQGIDLNKFLIANSAATYLMRVAGNDWRSSGIFDGDVIIIDRAVSARTNDLVIWWHTGSFAISPRHSLPEGAEVWGVVTSTIHQYRGRDE
jgi:DNA polymerase V